MAEDWDSYLCRVNGKLASIFLNLGQERDASRPWLIWAWVYMLHPRTDGLSSSEEAQQLWKIEESLTTVLTHTLHAKFVGRITVNGRREFYSYAADRPEAESAVASAMGSFAGYKYDCGTKFDPEWEQYSTVLFPSTEDLEGIKNRRVLDQLEKRGDRLDQPHEIRHWAYFRSEHDRERFILGISGFSYAVSGKSEDQTQEFPWGVCIAHTDLLSSIDRVTVELLRLAEAKGGQYDGWETQLIAPLN